MPNNAPIGIFDSGLGGLTVFAAIKRRLPRESLVYLGDTARVPYGTKSDETVVRYSLENAEFLESHGVKAIVLACNTASAIALPALTARSHIPVIGVVDPGARAALMHEGVHTVGVIGTPATIASDAYGRALRAERNVKVLSIACALFVPLVEEGWGAGDIPRRVAEEYLGPLKKAHIEVLILGCTHYPLMKEVIREVMGEGVRLVDSGEATADTLARLLDERGLAAESTHIPEDRIYVTDVPGKFETVARRFLGDGLPKVQRVSL